IRMRSKLAKVLHPVCGRPMVLFAVDLAETLAKGHVAVVVGYQAERVKDLLADRKVTLVEQTRRLGTGHAVAQAQAAFQGRGGNEWSGRRFVILSGDTPLLTEATVQALLATHERERATVTLLTAHIARDSIEALGVNTRAELADAERILRDRVRRKLMDAGATFLAPETCFVDPEVRIGRDTVIHPHTTLEGRTVIGEDCVIRS